jgi:hypothetical protein
MNHTSSVQIMSGGNVVGAYGELTTPQSTPKRSFQLRATGNGNISVEIFASNIPSPVLTNDGDFVSLGVISLSPAGTALSDGFTSDAPWRHVRAKVTVRTGTASADVHMGG